MANFDLRDWALKGAEQRLVEIAEEARAIFASFPELRGRGRGFDAAGSPDGAAAPRARRRRKRRMSAAARKAVSVRMKKYWASRRRATSQG